MGIVKCQASGNFGGILSKIKPKIPAALRALESEVLSSSEPYVPYKTGRLCASGCASGSGERGEIRYTAPYAKECYYAARSFSKKHHPHACAAWVEAAKSQNAAQWAQSVSRILL